jgi:multicomponent Na+:H+ antiporter subunit A
LVAPGSSLDQEAVSKLALWPGLNTPFVMSIVVLAVGATVGMLVPLVQKGSTASIGESVFDRVYDSVIGSAKRVTSVAQSGSLPAYVAVVIAIVGAAITVSLVTGGDLPTITRFSESWVQVVIAALTVAFTLGVVMVRLRFTAALLLGGVGFGVAMLFVLHGAPDLALTQLLVETLTIVVFLLAMRRMPRDFSPSSQWAPRSARVAAAVFIGIAVPLFAANVVASRTADSVSEEYVARSLTEAGGRNVVNVILVDFRGFDTMGEITVLALAAMGVANLVRMASRERRSKTSERVVS